MATLVTPQGMFFRSYEDCSAGRNDHARLARASAIKNTGAVAGAWPYLYGRERKSAWKRLWATNCARCLAAMLCEERQTVPASVRRWPDDCFRAEGLLSLYDGQKATPFPTAADDYLKAHKLYTSTLLRDGSLCVTTLSGGRGPILMHDGKLRRSSTFPTA